MQCPNCGAPAIEGDVFCGSCGATLTPPIQPTQVMPQVPQTPPVQQAPPTPQATAPYQQPPQPGFPPAAAAPATAPKGRSTGLIVAVVVLGVLLLIGLGVGGFFAWRAFSADDEPATTTTPADAPATDADADKGSSAEPLGFATPEEAIADSLPADWVYLATSEEADRVVFAIGPPASEYVEMVEVDRQSDGTWLAGEAYPIEGDDMGDETMAPEDVALQVVGEFIYAIQEGRAEDAHALTVSPFSEDPASAQYANGELDSFEITDAQMQADGSTVWVWSAEYWSWGTENYIYVCIPTENGYRISELRVP